MSRALRFQSAALLSLAGFFVALYMLLYHLGAYDSLICGPGSCDVVQSSRFARFLGQPVPGWGVAWYGGVFVLALLGLRTGSPSGIDTGLVAVAAVGLAFTVYLTWIELFVLHAVCMWCVVSGVLTAGIFGVSLFGWRREEGPDQEYGSDARPSACE